MDNCDRRDSSPMICVLCNRIAGSHALKGVLGDSKTRKLLSKTIGSKIISEPAFSDVICRNCVLETNLRIEYQYRIRMNMIKHRYEYYVRTGDKLQSQNQLKLMKRTKPTFIRVPSEAAQPANNQ